MKYKFLIVEDDALISEHLNEIVIGHGHEVSDICAHEQSALQSIEQNPPDFALLDIRLLGDDLGINIGRHLQGLGIPFVFITSFSDKQTIQEAVDVEPKGYILKPFEAAEVSAVINKLVECGKQSMTIKSGGIKYQLLIRDILFVQSENVYLEIHTSDKKYLVRKKLSDFLSKVSGERLIQVHRSFAVNPKKLTKQVKASLFINDVEIPVSKNYKKQVAALFE